MSRPLIQRSPVAAVPPSRRWRVLLLLGILCVVFLLGLRPIVPPHTDLDSSWATVLAWAAVHHLRWGNEIAFTYGPLGFANAGTNYIPGILPSFMVWQVLQGLAFCAAVAALLWRARVWVMLLFLAVFIASFPILIIDPIWNMTLLFATAALLDHDPDAPRWRTAAALLASAIVFAAIALMKFSLFPLWLLCLATLTLQAALRRQGRRAVFTLALFPASLVLVWLLCRQNLSDLPDYLHSSFAMVLGYGQAMGLGAPVVPQLTGVACLLLVWLASLAAAWRARRAPPTTLLAGLVAAAAFLIWRAGFTRGDHAALFFAACSLLPFALLAYRPYAGMRGMRVLLALVAVVAAAPPLPGEGIKNVLGNFWLLPAGLHQHARMLSTYTEDLQQSEQAWQALKRENDLPRIRKLVGDASIDMVTDRPSLVLLNDLHYTPRPVFQSYSAYTPLLEEINRAWLVGPRAPEFVLMQLSFIDGRLPLVDDGLALAALLQRYRAVTVERGFLLLQRQASALPLPLLAPPPLWQGAALEATIDVPMAPDHVTAAFIKLDLSFAGQVYSALLREPTLQIVVVTAGGERTFRLIRAAAAAGFVLSPALRHTGDWIALQFGLALPRVHSIRIQPEFAWQAMLFQPHLSVGFSPMEYLHGDAGQAGEELIGAVFPNFNLLPTRTENSGEVVPEDGRDALFIHAPGLLEFRPAPGRYRLTAEFGILNSALQSPGCAAAAADGIGMTVSLLHEQARQTLLHEEIDPFHTPGDAGPHPIALEQITLQAGDRIEYRVEAGHDGSNFACDWSYVRDLRFTPSPSPAATADQPRP